MGKFIKELSNDEVIKFFEDNHYSLVTHLKDNEGNLIPAIERDDDGIFVRCKKTEERSSIDMEVAHYLMKSHPGFLSFATLLSGQYNTELEMIVLKDFYLSKLCITDEDLNENDRLNEEFVKFMYSKFKDMGYKDEYNSHFDNLSQQEDSINEL